MGQPNIVYKNKKYYQIGCRECDKGTWRIYADGGDYVAECTSCGHKVELPPNKLKEEPDLKAISLRYFT